MYGYGFHVASASIDRERIGRHRVLGFEPLREHESGSFRRRDFPAFGRAHLQPCSSKRSRACGLR